MYDLPYKQREAQASRAKPNIKNDSHTPGKKPQTLKQKFIKYFSFLPDNEDIQPATWQIQQFLKTNKSDKEVENKLTKECRQVSVEELQHSTRIKLESNYFLGKSFRLKRNHPLGKTEIETLYKISTEQKLDQDNTQEEKLGEQDFPPQCSEIKEGKREINESKAPEWMDANIKINEVNIAKEGQPKMARIRDYWLEQQRT